jgi:prepilin-type N-terminal cleavage/methylation domain-containing protein
MKQSLACPRSSKLSSFTLVELLVVIGIIAILAAVLLSAGSMAIKSAKRAQAANMATQIQTAALAYYTEYSVYPIPPGTTTDWTSGDVAASATAWQSLIYCLSGNIHPSTGLATPTPATVITNSRGTAYLSFRSSDVDTTDAPKNPLPSGTEIYFNIAMDSDYDGVLGVTPSAVTTMPNFTVYPMTTASAAGGGSSTAGVAVWANCNGTTTSTNGNFYVHTY